MVYIGNAPLFPNVSRHIMIFSRAKSGVAFLSISNEKMRFSLLIWRDFDFSLQSSALSLNSTPLSFDLVSGFDFIVIDGLGRRRFFDLTWNLQNFSVFANVSMFPGMNDGNFSVLLLSCLESKSDFVQGVRYSNMNWNDEFHGVYNSFDGYGIPILRFWNRWELYHPAFFAFSIVFHLTCLILMILLRKYQPLRSRGIVPLFAVVWQIVHICTGLFNWVTPPGLMFRVLWSINFFWGNPMAVALLFAIFMVHGRYNILQILARRKERASTANTYQTKSQIIRIYEWSESIVFQIALLVVFYLMSLAIFAITTLIFDPEFKIYAPLSVFYVRLVIIVVLIVLNIPIAISVAWIGRKHLTCRNAFQVDPLYFKVEVYILYVIAALFYGFVRFLSLLWDSQDSDVMVILNSISYHITFFAQGFFPLCMTMIGWVRSQRIQRRNQTEFLAMLSDVDGFQVFLEFSKKEFSLENCLCYRDIMAYENANSDERPSIVAKILCLYLNGAKSELEVNCPGQELNEVKSQIEIHQLPDRLLDGVKNHVLTNICDTFSRLIYTNEYKEYLKEHNLLKEWGMIESESAIFLKEPLL